MDYSETSAFWLFNQVSNYAYTRYNMMLPFIQEKQNKLETGYLEQVASIDEKAKSLSEEEAQKVLTDFSIASAQNTFDEWKGLYHFLFARFLDGNVKTKIEIPENYKYVNPKIEYPGYGEGWYRKIIKETGEKFLYKGEAGH
jgi:hypothetical protein